MKLQIFILILLFTIAGYALGNWIPIYYLKISVEMKSLTSAEYFGIIIRTISAIVTFCAVLVALFKEDIRKIWEFVEFSISLPNDQIVEKLDAEETGSSDGSKTKYLKASLYESSLIVQNNGKLPARNCELYLERLLFKNGTYLKAEEIVTTGCPIQWNSTGDKKILIPPKGKKIIPIIKLTSPKEQSSPDQKGFKQVSKITFGDVVNPDKYTSGKWEANFVLYSENSNPYYFAIHLEWNGKWESRLTEMNKSLKIEIKNHE